MKQSETHVSTHQKYSDNFKQVKEWLQTVNDKLDVCREPPTDKHSLEAKLEKLNVSARPVKFWCSALGFLC